MNSLNIGHHYPILWHKQEITTDEKRNDKQTKQNSDGEKNNHVKENTIMTKMPMKQMKKV